MNQSWENGEKPNFEPNFGPNLPPPPPPHKKKLLWVLPLIVVRNCSKLSSYAI